MGTLLNRRRYMAGGGESPYDEFGYIKDGKLFHLDGINKGDDATAWTDLVGGYVFPLTTHSTIETDGVRFDGRGLLVSTTTIPCSNVAIVFPNSSSTIEVVFEPYSNNYFMFGIGSYNSVQFCKGSGYLGMNGQIGCSDTLFSVMSCNKNLAIGDGVTLEKGTAPSYGVPYQANAYIWLGGRNYGGQSYYTGKIHCIRMYNRLLTAEEMLHNQRVDNTRFNLGLTL